jgi:hypothetical protein
MTLGVSTPVDRGPQAVRPFWLQVPKEHLDDLRDRLARTRWPDEIAETGLALRRARRLPAGPGRVLAHELRLARLPGRAEQLPAVHDHHRRGERPLLACPLPGARRLPVVMTVGSSVCAI